MNLQALSVQGILPSLPASFETALIEYLLERFDHLLLGSEGDGCCLPGTGGLRIIRRLRRQACFQVPDGLLEAQHLLVPHRTHRDLLHKLVVDLVVRAEWVPVR